MPTARTDVSNSTRGRGLGCTRNGGNIWGGEWGVGSARAQRGGSVQVAGARKAVARAPSPRREEVAAREDRRRAGEGGGGREATGRSPLANQCQQREGVPCAFPHRSVPPTLPCTPAAPALSILSNHPPRLKVGRVAPATGPGASQPSRG
jgi:hypothetical protein